MALRWLLSLLGLLMLLPAPVRAQEVVVLPFANLTGRHEAFEMVLPAVYDQLSAHEVDFVRHDEVRPVLRQHRIRALGEIGLDDAALLREETGARFALLGSLDIYSPEGSLEVNLSGRVLDLQDRRLVTAVSVGRTVQETEGWFATGRAEDIETVMLEVVAELVGQLEPYLSLPLPERERYHTCGLVALIPLDDYSNSPYGAEVLQNLLMAELVEHGWAVVEPGFVREILLDAQRVARGGVSDEVRDILRDELGVCWVVTGEVETFVVSPGGQEAAVPSLGFGLRLVDARGSGLRATLELERDGAEGEGLFRRGREYSVARLARTVMEEVVEWMQREGDR